MNNPNYPRSVVITRYNMDENDQITDQNTDQNTEETKEESEESDK